ncbi:MAG: ABC transporter permease [Hyphomicrobiaceae bacterium]|nr:ABC transporter permease [Hyphomicrobiaceae bacterium]
MQADSVAGKSLTLVISIMCFLACLTAGTVYLINKSASAWLRNIATEVTVQIEPAERMEDTDSLAKAVKEYVERESGIVSARVLSISESSSLLEPWLGVNSKLLATQLPRLIAVQLHPRISPDLRDLEARLGAHFPRVAIDDHRQWQDQIRTVTHSFALGGIAILFLVGAATTAIIISATYSAMASNHEIVEVLNFVGATDRFIAHEFEKHFLRLGVRAGVVGAASAMAVFSVMPLLVEFLGSGTLTNAELKRFIGNGMLDSYGYIVLLMIVIIITLLCVLTSRFGVFRILHNQL